MPEEVKSEVVQKTQKSLGKYVKKPALTEKLLKKPPFRFLHDIVNAVIKETGFLRGLYTEDELNSENVKEKEAKLAFLAKLIEAVKVITNTELTVKPSKVIAGLEPSETNILLQTIAKAVDKKVDSSDYVKKLKSGEIIPTAEKKKTKKSEKLQKPVVSNKEKPNEVPTKEKKRRTPSTETPKSTDRSKIKKPSPRESNKPNKTKEVKIKNKQKPVKEDKVDKIKDSEDIQFKDEPTTILPTETIENEPVVPTKPPEIPKIEDDNLKISDEVIVERRSTSANRPKSARPRSGDVKRAPVNDDSDVTNQQPIELSSTIDSNPSPVINKITNRPKSSLLRPPSVRPSSARPGAPRLRPDSSLPLKEPIVLGKINVIVESFDDVKDGDDEETTVVIQTSNSDVDEPEVGSNDSGDKVSDDIENKGHLVEQILEQINEKGDGIRSNNKTEIDWQNDGKDSASKDANNLRGLIQSLTKTANPLGKLLNYLHEDIDAMHTELQTWTATKKQLFAEISKQKKISSELDKPLLSQLDNLRREIGKIDEEIVTTRHNILRNDSRIKELLSK